MGWNNISGKITKEQLPASLTHLYLEYNRIENLDITNLTKLKILFLHYNKHLSSFDLKGNQSLKFLKIPGNDLKEFNIGNNNSIYML